MEQEPPLEPSAAQPHDRDFVLVGPEPPAGGAGSTRRTALTALAIAAPVLLLGFAWNRCLFTGCPDVSRLSSYRPGGAPVVLDRHGKAIADLAPVEGEVVALKSLPAHVANAFVAVEDKRFREHGAVDLPRVLAASVANVRQGRVDQGFSTITMQLARNVFPDQLPASRRTLARKLLEIRVAQEIERSFGKDEILEMYLNHIAFGHGARGIEAASRYYFGRPARELDVAQAAVLAALPKAPTHYDPRRRPERAKERRDLVLTLMEQQGRLTREAAEAARSQPLRVAVRPGITGAAPPLAGWFVEEVRRELEETIGPDLYDEKLRVHTTLDADAQQAAQEELVRQLESVEKGALGRFSGPAYDVALGEDLDVTPYLQGAVVALDVESGDVLAWVGGRDFRQSRFDRVRNAHRQLGSAFKPFVFAAAVNAGRMMSQPLSDEPLRVPMGRKNVWQPKNFDGGFEGHVTLREALVRSKNVPTVRLATDVGYDLVARLAEDAGVPDVPRLPSMALGTASVSPLELASAYTAFAGMGDAVHPRLVTKVERANGEVVWRADPVQKRRVMAPAVAYIVTDALRDALSRGTGSEVRRTGFKAPAAGKTGTTNDGTDAWFVGYTPAVLTAVWIGFDEQRPIMERATGGRLAAPVWARMMMRLQSAKSGPEWARPAEVLEGRVDPATGLMIASGCPPWDGVGRRELFLRPYTPVSACPSPLPSDWQEAETAGEPFDDEEGLQTGLLAEAPAEPRADEARFYAAPPAPAAPEPTATPEPPR
ncbi:MAG: PBP1A family penicillin-binding protein [Vicinamibacteria bacterium]